MPQDLDKTLQIFIFRVLGAVYSPICKTWRTRIVLATCFGQGRERLYEFDRFLCKSLIHSSKQTLWLSRREFKWLFDPPQKRIQVSDRSRQPPKVLDSCSSSQIHLWSKSKIFRLSAARLSVGRAQRFGEHSAEISRRSLKPQI